MAYSDPEVAPPGRRRELVAVLLMLIGMIGLLICAFAVDPVLGCATLAAFVFSAGVVLGITP